MHLQLLQQILESMMHSQVTPLLNFKKLQLTQTSIIIINLVNLMILPTMILAKSLKQSRLERKKRVLLGLITSKIMKSDHKTFKLTIFKQIILVILKKTSKTMTNFLLTILQLIIMETITIFWIFLTQLRGHLIHMESQLK